MDIHIISELSTEDLKTAHLEDLKVQEKYDVRYRQYWVNQEAGTVFCLIEGPDAESCEAVHREAHGNVACNIVKVEPGFYKQFLGEGQQVDSYGLVRNEDGDIDLGYRLVLVVHIRSHSAEALVADIISKHRGNILTAEHDDHLIAVFKKPATAVSCALDIKQTLEKKIGNSDSAKWNNQFKIGIGTGQPLGEIDGFFEKALKDGRLLSVIANDGEILATGLVKRLLDLTKTGNASGDIRFVKSSEVEFLASCIETIEKKMSDSTFNVGTLSKNMGMSRSQLYRKISSITGKPPNKLIRDLKMRKALKLINEGQYNISEISLEVGFQNPSYFSRCFHEKFGVPPSKVTA